MVFRENSSLKLPFMTEPLPADQIFIRRLTDIVMANLGNEEFGVKELVKESGTGVYSLSRRLHSINGKTVNQFIREVRLQKALEMLQNGEHKASEVAFRVGFSSPAYFNKCFHELYGYPPGKVKKRISAAQMENIAARVNSKKVKRPAWQAVIFLSSVILILSAIVYLFFLSFIKTNSSDGTIGVNQGKSLAVLPFRNLSNNITDQYFNDGIMEEILTSLNRIHDLRVISRTTVDQYRNSKETITEIARKLHVNYILEGSGQKYGNFYRLRVQLIDVSDDRHLWAESYELDIRETKELFTIQSQIAQTIASELKATITPEEKELIERIPTADMTAYDIYLKANNYQKEYQVTRDLDTYKQAVTFYKAALEIDPAFAKAYAGLASLYLTRHFREAYFEKDYLDSCLILADKALSFDGQLDEAYYTIGRCYFEKGIIEKALANFDRSLQINPNNADAQSYRGYLLTSVIYDYVGGIDSYQKSLNTGPPEYRPDLLRGLGQAYLDVGFIERAKGCYKQAFEIDRNKGLYLFLLSDVEYCLEDFEMALKLGYEANEADSAYFPETTYFYGPVEHNSEMYLQAKKLIRSFEKSGEFNLNQAHRIGYAFWKVGKYNEAKIYFDQQIRYSLESIRLNRRIAQKKGAQYDLAATYAFLGNKEIAYRYLDDFSTRNFYPLWWVTLAKNDPLFNTIRTDERFQAILQSMEAKYRAEHERVRKWLENKGK